eukprot:scaffold109299_cov35-Cyclotella_meneghiniana.AAC.1
MPGYVQKQLTKYNHPAPSKPQHCPYEPSPIKYGSASQDVLPQDYSPPLDKDGIQYLQQVIGPFLYYCRATDTTIPHALSELASKQSHATQNTLKKCKQFLNYMATHPDATIRYYASDMILNAASPEAANPSNSTEPLPSYAPSYDSSQHQEPKQSSAPSSSTPKKPE